MRMVGRAGIRRIPSVLSHNRLSPGQSPVTECDQPAGHNSYDFNPRLWLSLDGNDRFGASTAWNGVPSPSTRQTNSRVGVMALIHWSRIGR